MGDKSTHSTTVKNAQIDVLKTTPKGKESIPKIIFWTVLFQIAWHFRRILPFMNEGNYLDADDFLRLHEVRNWMSGQNWFDVTVWRMNPPAGGDMHWSRIVDVPIAGLIWFFDLFFDQLIAERLASIVWPTLLLIATVLVVLAICEKLFPDTNRLISLLFTVTCFTALAEFAPSRIDHHGPQIFLYCVTLFGLVNADRSWGHYLIGVSMAASIAIGLDGLLLLIVVLAWLGTEWALQIDSDGAGLKRIAISLTASMVFFFLIGVAPDQWFAARCDAISITYLSMMLAISISFYLLASLTNILDFKTPVKTFVYRSFAGLVAAGISLAVLYRFFPQCSAGPLSGISPELEKTWLSKISEAKGMLEYVTTIDPPMASVPLYLVFIILCGLALLLTRKFSPRLLAIWVTLVFTFILGFIQIRAYRIGIFAIVPICVMTAQWLWDTCQRRFENSKTMAMIVACMTGLFLISPVWLGFGYLLTTPTKVKSAEPSEVTHNANPNLLESICNKSSQFTELAALQKGLVFNDLDSGPAILVFTHHSIVGGSYHRNPDAILDVQKFFSSDPATAYQIINKRNPDYVALCQLGFFAAVPNGKNNTMAAKVVSGELPNWLERISAKTDPLILLKFKP